MAASFHHAPSPAKEGNSSCWWLDGGPSAKGQRYNPSVINTKPISFQPEKTWTEGGNPQSSRLSQAKIHTGSANTWADATGLNDPLLIDLRCARAVDRQDGIL
jgi:hypothetical protein